jgi:O-antigen/teichoic acid export membrane protein
LFVSVYIYRSLIGSFIWNPNPVLAKTTFLATIPFGLQILLGNYGNLHIVLLENFHGAQETGIFKAAQALMPIMVTVGGIFGNVLYPRLSRAYQTSKEQFQRLISKGIHYMLVSSLPMAIGMFLLADRIIILLYGAEYEGSALYLRLLCTSIPFTVMGSVLSTGLTSANRQGLRTTVLVLGLISNVLCSFWLIPSFRGLGAGLTHLIVRSQNFIIFLLISLKILGGFYQVKKILPMLIASALMTLYILAANRFPLLILISGGALVYGSVLFIGDRVVRQDFHQIQFKELFKSLFVQVSSLSKD